MKVSRAQADKNRDHVIEVAGRLFRERGFDGIGLSDLMEAAGLTRGAFYGQFESKEDLAARASERALARNADRWSQTVAKNQDDPFTALVRYYLSDRHRVRTGEGCAFAALATDAARSGPALQSVFEEGVKTHLGILDTLVPARPGEDVRDASLAALATMVGALVLSRSVRDKTLSQRILDAAAGTLTDRASTRNRASEAGH
jgi:TetR/AcrR family transcriptional repressor of nem operon